MMIRRIALHAEPKGQRKKKGNMKGYKAVLFAPDGDWVTDFEGDTKEEVIDKLADKGSRWYFYPFEGIIRDWGGYTTSVQRLVDLAPNIPQELVGKSIKTVSNWLKGLTGRELYNMAAGG